MLVLSDADVRSLLPLDEAIAFVKLAFIEFSAGRIICPQRGALPLQPPGAVLLTMPAYDGTRYVGVKTVTVQPANATRELPVVRASYQLFEASTGEAVALMPAEGLTEIRTGAAGGLAASLLALPDIESLAVIGAGTQALAQVFAACAVRPIKDIWVFSRTASRAQAFAAAVSAATSANVHLTTSADEAVSRTQLVITATTATEPVFSDRAVCPGTHITAVGAFTINMQEVPPMTVARAVVFVDAVSAAWQESGDLVQPRASGLITQAHLSGEIGALADGRIQGRTSAEQITVFKSVGLAAQDLVCASEVYQRALSSGAGTSLSWT